MKRGLLLPILALLLLSIVMTGCGSKSTNNETGTNTGNASTNNAGTNDVNTEKKSWSKPPEMNIDSSKTYEAEFHTSKGDFTVELYAKDAPITVNNFVFLAKEGFYDGVTFHRIIETFMIQTGDPTGTGAGGPGYNIEDELGSKHSYEPGIVAMANTTQPNTGGSQFFICTGTDSASLNSQPNYSIFGKVKEGMDIVLAIAGTPVEMGSSGEVSSPTEKITIDSISIKEQ